MTTDGIVGEIDSRPNRILRWVIALNVATCLLEIAVAATIGSVSLVADSTDFLEDATIGTLVLVGLRWGPRDRARLGRCLAVVIVLPGLAALALIVLRWGSGQPPEAVPLGLTGFFALAVNGTCSFLLARVGPSGGSLVRAAFLAARNDVLANVAVLGAAGATAFTRSPLPDLLIGLAIVLLNSGAAVEVWRAASREGDADDD